MTNKKIPSIRFKEFSDDWENIKLSNLMLFSNGINAPKENYGSGRKMISVMDILNEQPIKYDHIRSSVKVDEKIEAKNKVEYGDLVFVRSSEIIEEVGWAKAYLEYEYSLFSGFSIRGKQIKKFNSLFAELTLNFTNRKQIERKSGGSTRYNIGQNILNSLEILMPLINEQDKIASFFKNLDKLISLRERELSLLKQQKKGFLQNMFPKTGKKKPEVRFDGYTEDWEERELDDVLTERKIEQAQSDEYPLVSFTVEKGVTPKTERYEREQLVVGNAKSKKYKITELDDIVYNPANLKFGAISRNNYGKAVFSPIYVTFKVNNSITYPTFIEMFVTRNDFIKMSLKYQQGTVYERQAVSPENFLSMTFLSPSKNEQKKIGTFFKHLDDIISLNQKELDLLKETKKGFLQKMFI